jgi:hypothetical protein
MTYNKNQKATNEKGNGFKKPAVVLVLLRDLDWQFDIRFGRTCAREAGILPFTHPIARATLP